LPHASLVIPPTHVPPLMQPGQTHAPVTHDSPVAVQSAHVLPTSPHAMSVGGEVQTLPVQHPVAHVVDVQAHWPFTHVWVAVHIGPLFCHWPHASH
jgi:hypothetical protein